MPEGALRDRLGRLLEALAAPGNPCGIHNAMVRIDCPASGVTIELATGPTDAAGRQPLSPDHPFHVASIAKTMTAVLALQLAEGGQIDLDRPVAELGLLDPFVLERLPAARQFTLYHLLTHTAGLRDGMVDDNQCLAADAGGLAPGSLIGRMLANPAARGGRQWQAWDAARAQEPDAGTLNWFLAHAATPVGPVGGQFHYSDTGFVLIALMLERIRGYPLHEQLARHIFAPAGMAQSWLAYRSEPPGGMPDPCEIWLEDIPVLGAGMDLSFDWGGGGIVATLADLNRFQMALAAGRLFARPETLARMTAWIEPAELKPPRSGIGLGLFRQDAAGLELHGHSGAWGGKMFHVPEHGVFFSGTANQARAPADWHFPFIKEAIGA